MNAAYLLAPLAAAVAVFQAYAAFAEGPERALLLPTLALLFACAGAARLFWSRFPDFAATPARELLALGWVVAGMVAVLVWNDTNTLSQLQGWQYALLLLAPTGLALHSQVAFVGYLTAHAALLLLALAIQPSGLAALGFMGLSLLCCAALGQRATGERFPQAGARLSSLGWLRGALPFVALLGLLFCAFSATKPAAETTTAKDWILWLQGQRANRPRGVDVSGPGGRPGGEVEGAQIPGTGATPVPGGLPASAAAAPEQGPPKVGFSRDLKFQDLGGTDERVALFVRVRTPRGGEPDPLRFQPYWAAGALSRYDGQEWTAAEEERALSGAEGRIELEGEVRGGRLYEQEVVLWESGGRALFGLYPVERLDLPRATLDGEGRLRRAASGEGRLRYSLRSRWVQADARRLRRDAPRTPDLRYLDVPSSLFEAPAFQRIARELREGGSDPVGRIQATMSFLSRMRYDMAPGLPEGQDPTLAFLERGRGYCQHFASAMTLLLRAQGIPARIGIGYAGGEWANQGGYYVVRQKHAHAWVEVPFRRSGWVVFDPASASLRREGPPSAPPDLALDPGPGPRPSRSAQPTPLAPDAPPQPTPSVEPSEAPRPTPSAEPSQAPRATPGPQPTPGGAPRPSATPRVSPSRPTPRPRPSRSARPSPSRSVRPSPRDSPVGSPFDRLWQGAEDPAGEAGSEGPEAPGAPGGPGGSAAEGSNPEGPPGQQPEPGQPGAAPGASPRPGGPGPREPGAPSDAAGQGPAEDRAGSGPGQARAARPVEPRAEVEASARYVVEALFRDGILVVLAALLGVGGLRLLRELLLERERTRTRDEEEAALSLGADEAAELPGGARAPGEAAREVVRLYLRALAAYARRGRAREGAETPWEFSARVTRGSGPLCELTDLFVRARYGPWPLEPSDLERARGLAGAIERGD